VAEGGALLRRYGAEWLHRGFESLLLRFRPESGKVVTVSRDVPSFTSVDLTGAATVSVAVGKKTALTISGDDNIVPLIRTEVCGGELVISSKHGYTTDNGVDIRISTPSLVGSTMLGAGSLTATGIDSNSFGADVIGAGRLELAGKTGTVDVNLSGVGAVELSGLLARDAHVKLSGTGNVHVYATDTLDASVDGVGSISYSGNPSHVRKHVTGLGAITAD
jgi:Putative auto-transporter adhesin, head GIN domain